MAAKCVVHIVPVGHTAPTLIGSIRRYPAGKVILVRGKDKTLQGAKEAEDTAKAVKKALGSITCADLLVDIDDIEQSALSIAERILEERGPECDVLVNLSGSLRSLDVAAYLAALATGSEAYMGLPEYKDKKIVGVRKVVPVPLMPLKDLSIGKRNILRRLSVSPDGMLLGDLTAKPKMLREEAMSERSLISYHLSDLKKDCLVETKKEGRNIKAKLTFAGKLYALGLAEDLYK